MVSGPSQSDTTTKISVVVSDGTKQKLNRIAYDQSTPNETVKMSQIVREAITDYLEKYEQNPENCHPQQRGSLGDSTERGEA